MNNNKKTKPKFNFITIYILGFIISIFFEFYYITYHPYDYFMLFGIGIILCIFGYLSIDGILEIINQANKKRDEQNELVIKASKAIYLTTKKIALNGSSTPDAPASPNTLESRRDINTLLDELVQANERLEKEVENAVSIQSLIQKNKSMVNNVREIMDGADRQPLSSLEIEKELKLEEAIAKTDFETVTQPKTIDTMMEQEITNPEINAKKTDTDISEETAGTVGNITAMEEPAKTETVSEQPISETIPESVSEQPISETIPEPVSEQPVSETIPESVSEQSISETIPEPVSEQPVSETIPESVSEQSISETIPEPVSEQPVSELMSDVAVNNLAKDENAVADTEKESEPSQALHLISPEEAMDALLKTVTLSMNTNVDDTPDTTADTTVAKTDSKPFSSDTSNSPFSDIKAAAQEESNSQLTPDEIASLFANL